jgi:hypothetical protein
VEFMLLSRHGKRLGHTSTAASRRARPSGMVASPH